MKPILFALCITCFAISCGDNQSEPKGTSGDSNKYDINKDSSVTAGEMKRYWLVLLQKGPNRNQDSISAEKIQAAHMANINRLAREGKLIMAGPVGVEDDLRGIFLMDCADSAEVENFVKTDSAVATGRLIMKYYPWWTMKGKYIFK
ncbi:MAG TPA: YciI family protein [Chitinophagaceae bacterium]|nr:YciI family protein [Chitinophagaceae bacterium]